MQTVTKLMTIKDIAEKVQCCPTHIHNLKREKRMPQPLKIGRNIRWHPDVIAEWIANGCPPCE